jgi:hypothetical protein
MPVYLNFYHGRHTSEEDLDDWGFNGPVFGPFSVVQVTYGCHIKAIGHLNGNLAEFTISNDGLVEVKEAFYGDFSIIDEEQFRLAFEDRWKKTQKILAIPEKDLPLLINETEEWVKIYVERSLKHDPGKPSAPRRSRNRRPGHRRGKSPQGKLPVRSSP